jgi:hypothetical protein
MTFIGTDVSEERITSNIRAKRMMELGKTLAVTSKGSTLRMATRRQIPEDEIL